MARKRKISAARLAAPKLKLKMLEDCKKHNKDLKAVLKCVVGKGKRTGLGWAPYGGQNEQKLLHDHHEYWGKALLDSGVDPWNLWPALLDLAAKLLGRADHECRDKLVKDSGEYCPKCKAGKCTYGRNMSKRSVGVIYKLDHWEAAARKGSWEAVAGMRYSGFEDKKHKKLNGTLCFPGGIRSAQSFYRIWSRTFPGALTKPNAKKIRKIPPPRALKSVTPPPPPEKQRTPAIYLLDGLITMVKEGIKLVERVLDNQAAMRSQIESLSRATASGLQSLGAEYDEDKKTAKAVKKPRSNVWPPEART